MKVGIPKEIYPHERRVAATPDTVQKMLKLGLEVLVEAGAGDAPRFADAAYVEAGATIVDARRGLRRGRHRPQGPPADARGRAAGTRPTC